MEDPIAMDEDDDLQNDEANKKIVFFLFCGFSLLFSFVADVLLRRFFGEIRMSLYFSFWLFFFLFFLVFFFFFFLSFFGCGCFLAPFFRRNSDEFCVDRALSSPLSTKTKKLNGCAFFPDKLFLQTILQISDSA